MKSKTRENIYKKKIIKNKRRRFSFFRLFIFLSILAILAFIVWHILSFIYNGYQMYSKNYALYNQRREELVQDKENLFSDYTNILFIGVDEGVQEKPDTKPLQEADTLLLMSMENKTGKLRFIAIPPHTAIYASEEKQIVPIRSIYKKGTETAILRETAKLLGVVIHHYITIDLDTLREAVDKLGGLDIYVEHKMDYEDPNALLSIHLMQGNQHLDGEHVLKYLRYRSDDLGDIGRVQRQQQFTKALFKEIMTPSTITKIPWLVDVLNNRLKTSFEVFDVLTLTKIMRQISTQEPLMLMLKGQETKDTKLWQIDKKEIDLEMKKLFPIVKADSR